VEESEREVVGAVRDICNDELGIGTITIYYAIGHMRKDESG
jgi:hypothetical protein